MAANASAHEAHAKEKEDTRLTEYEAKINEDIHAAAGGGGGHHRHHHPRALLELSDLPEEVIHYLLGTVHDAATLATCELVCHQWRRLAASSR